MVSQTPGGFTLLPFPPRPQLLEGRRRVSARAFLQHSREQIPVQQEAACSYLHSSLEGISVLKWISPEHNQMAAKNKPPHPPPTPSLPALTEHCLCPSTAPSLGFPTKARPGCSSRVYYIFLGLFFFFFSPPLLVISSNLLSVIWD